MGHTYHCLACAVMGTVAISAPAAAQAIDLQRWGAFGALDGIEWFSEGQVPQRVSIPTWSGDALVIYHGVVARMQAGLKYADIVQRIEKDSTPTGFRITYSYEDGRKLIATGTLQPDGSVIETFTDFGGVARQNRYVTSGRKAKIIRRTKSSGQWADGVATLKIGITRAEQQANLEAERRQREASLTAARQRRQEIEARELAMREEEQARYDAEQAEEEAAEEAEALAQRQRNWAMIERGVQDVVDHNRRLDEGSETMLENIQRSQDRYEARQNQIRSQQERPREPAYIPPPLVEPRNTGMASNVAGSRSASTSPSVGQANIPDQPSPSKQQVPAYVRGPNLPQTKAPPGFWDNNEFIVVQSPSEANSVFERFYGNDKITETLAFGCYPDGIGGYNCQRRVRRPLTGNQRGRSE